jgi:PIN domain nuclease of toxin-antitoxin system
MDVGVDGERPAVPAAAAEVILLDTNALIWLGQGHKRVRDLARFARLYVSPASVLELQFLAEAGRLRMSSGLSAFSIVDDRRWLLDDPPSAKWFEAAAGLGWTRDPFDRLIVGHARLRGWKLATSDTALIDQLPSTESIRL